MVSSSLSPEIQQIAHYAWLCKVVAIRSQYMQRHKFAISRPVVAPRPIIHAKAYEYHRRAIELSVADLSDETTFSPRCQLDFPTESFVQKQRAVSVIRCRLNNHKETYAGVSINLAKAPFRPRGGQSSIFRPGKPVSYSVPTNLQSQIFSDNQSLCSYGFRKLEHDRRISRGEQTTKRAEHAILFWIKFCLTDGLLSIPFTQQQQ